MRTEALATALDRIALPDGIAFGVSGPTDPASLWPEEASAVARAVPGRRTEFAGGRAAARQAMQRLGLPPAAVPSGTDRAPIWPAGLVGSLTHAEGTCLAVLARSATCLSLGVDLERDQPLDPALHDEITRPEEVSASSRRDLRLRFSAKEAVYKALYPQTRVLFGFDGLSVDLQRGRAALVRTPETAAIPDIWHAQTFDVAQWRVAGAIVSLVMLPHPRAGGRAQGMPATMR
ncbi:4'-phosphopantetheinyl transferase family protein [Pseudoponticoccus marisrubri]|uniref:Enterobactin synthase component D n=1 Tax=Pseudoponticoccus marisrubri TaxID=1685382 RepID=A0A0W7WHW4_9RHOB|nr:4'-phosphopantetheinyl transferase superfamily protein [Pseudoponticoccus marisrubri]KUF10173.1 hypothetical protein AVJ23_14085 [Pseudoponticoccus marisrubri]